MTLFDFIRRNLRWVAGGFLLGFGSSFGQTFFIAQFSSQIRETYNLSHGDFGSIYMFATLASAATLIYLAEWSIIIARSLWGALQSSFLPDSVS